MAPSQHPPARISEDPEFWVCSLCEPPSLRVDYHCGLVAHRECCLEHTGYAPQKAASWWLRRDPDGPVPVTINEALVAADRLRRPHQIAVRSAGRFTEVVDARLA